MSEYVKPDAISLIPIEGGELRLSVAFDVIHSFPSIGAHILKYIDCENSSVCNVLLPKESVKFLQDKCGLYVIERNFIYQTEHDAWVNYAAKGLNESDYGL